MPQCTKPGKSLNCLLFSLGAQKHPTSYTYHTAFAQKRVFRDCRAFDIIVGLSRQLTLSGTEKRTIRK